VLFARAVATDGDPALARRALALEPTFHEAHLLLGHGARAERRLGTAETHYRSAFEALPYSVAAGMALGDVSFSLEAWPQALRAYEQVVVAAPEHREAHLRRGIVLTFLGRPHEAMAALHPLLELGFWFLGEAHYWMARNLAQVDRPGDALDHLEQAAHYLPDDPRVHELAGRLALDGGAVEEAREDFLRVVEIDSRWPGRYDGHEALCGALSGLARIASAEKLWPGAAGRFEEAADCQGAGAELVSGEIVAIRTWGLSPSREARLIRGKERARDSLRLRQAAGLYNAAACAFNAGERVRATGLAERAAEHPQYAEKADTLILRILAPL
jgi:tetratricopeptide (TPR) repeat protein